MFLPSIRSARGKILNVASIAAYFPGDPAAYYASKAFVLSFSLALSQELHSQGRHGLGTVSRLHQDRFSGPRRYRCIHGLGRLPVSTAMEVAEAGYAGLIVGYRKIVPGFFNKVSVSLLPFLPKALILTVISRLQQNRARLP